MNRKMLYKPLKIAALHLMLVLLISCGINEPVAPRWDVSLNLPILNKNYTMFDILEKKSPEVSHYTEGANKDVLYYSDVNKLDNIKVNDNLKIDPFSENKSKEIGPIAVAPDSVVTNVGYDWVGVPVTPGSKSVLSPVNNATLNQLFSSVDGFQYAQIDTGVIELFITNHFPSPVIVTLNNLEISNQETGEIITTVTTPTSIDPGATIKLSDLPIAAGVVMQKKLVLNGLISSTGSNGQVITLPPQSLTIKAGINKVEVSEVTGKIPEQKPVEVDGTLKIDETAQRPSMFSTVELSSGSLNLTLSNNLDIDAVATITIPNLKNSQGIYLKGVKTILRKQQNVKVYDNFSLADYFIESPDGTPTNKVSYFISVTPLSSNDYRCIKCTDEVVGVVEFNNLHVKEFSGQLKPTALSQTRTAISLNVKDIQDKLNFQKIDLKNPIVEMRLKPTTQVECSIDGRMEAENSIGEKSVMTLSSRTLNKTLVTPTDTIITINPDSLNVFFKKFTKFPDSLIVYTGGTVNPNYKNVNIKESDQLTGTSRVEFPLNFNINDAFVKDSVKVELSNDDRNKIKDINSFETSLKISNGIPSNVTFIGRFYDEYDNPLLYLRSDQDTVFTFPGAVTDDNGNVISKSDQTIKIVASNGDPEKISRAKYLRVYLNFSTSGQNDSPVKFKTDDMIELSLSGNVNYNVNSK